MLHWQYLEKKLIFLFFTTYIYNLVFLYESTGAFLETVKNVSLACFSAVTKHRHINQYVYDMTKQ